MKLFNRNKNNNNENKVTNTKKKVVNDEPEPELEFTETRRTLELVAKLQKIIGETNPTYKRLLKGLRIITTVYVSMLNVSNEAKVIVMNSFCNECMGKLLENLNSTTEQLTNDAIKALGKENYNDIVKKFNEISNIDNNNTKNG